MDHGRSSIVYRPGSKLDKLPMRDVGFQLVAI